MIDDFRQYLEEAAEKVEMALEKVLKVGDPAVIFEAMRYSTLDGGKRIRAALCFLGAYGSEELALPAACAVEMIHAYSLIHDDLPCMDNDDFRRGKPSCHKAYGEAVALLAGDALIAKAFEVLATQENNALLAVKELAQASGTQGMVGGQVLDLLSENKAIGSDQLKTIHAKKTGVLISTSLKLGALAADRKELLPQLTTYGEKIGLCSRSPMISWTLRALRKVLANAWERRVFRKEYLRDPPRFGGSKVSGSEVYFRGEICCRELAWKRHSEGPCRLHFGSHKISFRTRSFVFWH